MPAAKPIAPNSTGTASGGSSAKPSSSAISAADAEADADDALAARRVGGQEAAERPCRRRCTPCRSSGTSPPGAGTSCSWRAASGAKACTPLSDHRVEEEEGEAHPDRGDAQEVDGCPRAGAAACTRRRLRGARARARAGAVQPQHAPAPPTPARRRTTSATRHEKASASGTSIAGASAQPRLPVMPCTLKAWPSRARATLRLSKRVVDRMEDAVADAGDAPRRAASIAVARARGEAERGQRRAAPRPPNSTGRGPKRSTTKPDSACTDAGDDEEDRHQQPELGVADVEGILQPRERAARSSSWLKWLTQCARPTRPITLASCAGGAAAAAGRRCAWAAWQSAKRDGGIDSQRGRRPDYDRRVNFCRDPCQLHVTLDAAPRPRRRIGPLTPHLFRADAARPLRAKLQHLRPRPGRAARHPWAPARALDAPAWCG